MGGRDGGGQSDGFRVELLHADGRRLEWAGGEGGGGGGGGEGRGHGELLQPDAEHGQRVGEGGGGEPDSAS